MSSIGTPLGEIQVYLDGQLADFCISPIENDSIHPKSVKRYLIEMHFKPDRNEHTLSCMLIPSQPVQSYVDTGERCEGIVYHDEEERAFVLIGGEGDDYSPYYDYWLEITENAVSYVTRRDTRTSTYRFGVMVAKVDEDGAFDLSVYDVDPACLKRKRK